MKSLRSVRRLSIVVCVSVAGLAASPVAGAACTGSNTCFGLDALPGNTGGGNSAFGWETLRDNTTGTDNTALGRQAMRLNTTGALNTAVGFGALGTSNGDSNTAVGVSALNNNTTGDQNTATGVSALSTNSEGTRNTANGVQALGGNSTGSDNTAMGYRAGSNIFMSNGNTALGAAAMLGFRGTENTATGFQALYGYTDVDGNLLGKGNYNSAAGAYSLKSNSGSNNTASGHKSLFQNTTGNGNTANGVNALAGNTSGNYNTASGLGALRNSISGFRNVAVGYQAGQAVTTGSDNIIVGGQNPGTAGDTGVIRIGNGTYQKRAFIAGVRGVATGGAAVAVMIDANGQLGTISSSRELKEDIQPMGSISERLLLLRPVTFRYKTPNEDGSQPLQFGLVAEEVAEVFPELVVDDKDGKPETVSYHVLSSLLLNELQKEHRATERLQEQVERQAAQLAEVKNQLQQLAPMARDSGT